MSRKRRSIDTIYLKPDPTNDEANIFAVNVEDYKYRLEKLREKGAWKITELESGDNHEFNFNETRCEAIIHFFEVIKKQV